MDDGRSIGVDASRELREIPSRRRLRRVGSRPRPGINIDPMRRRALAELVQEGLTLQEIADRLGVTRQCIHAQLQKLPELEAIRRASRASRASEVREKATARKAYEDLLGRGETGRALVRFLRLAEHRGWTVEVVPRRRARVNGIPLAFHRPVRLRPSTRTGVGTTRYFHVRISCTDWLHVVLFPNGNLRVYLPGEIKRTGSLYIPVEEAERPIPWPDWPTKEGSRSGTSAARAA